MAAIFGSATGRPRMGSLQMPRPAVANPRMAMPQGATSRTGMMGGVDLGQLLASIGQRGGQQEELDDSDHWNAMQRLRALQSMGRR